MEKWNAEKQKIENVSIYLIFNFEKTHFHAF